MPTGGRPGPPQPTRRRRGTALHGPCVALTLLPRPRHSDSRRPHPPQKSLRRKQRPRSPPPSSGGQPQIPAHPAPLAADRSALGCQGVQVFLVGPVGRCGSRQRLAGGGVQCQGPGLGQLGGARRRGPSERGFGVRMRQRALKGPHNSSKCGCGTRESEGT